MMRPTSQSHKTLSSYAFLTRPNFLLLKVTCLHLSSSIVSILIFLLPIMRVRFINAKSKNRNLLFCFELLFMPFTSQTESDWSNIFIIHTSISSSFCSRSLSVLNLSYKLSTVFSLKSLRHIISKRVESRLTSDIFSSSQLK